MKEMRAKRAAEKMVEAEFGDEVKTQKSKVKEVNILLAINKEDDFKFCLYSKSQSLIFTHVIFS